ncbi:phosphorylase superfamily domain-containing protein [Cordyceps javanica]|uniref:Phosphorylase superfamily domain-containing protein n=1 Tax=Cordyceps javanica TaxID=43265 RepID=A0A545VV91_9HYPO|nr:phosphorylase superfamily domain-containing protein [Cordyceps javanica]TQW05642.1 phosphorylase superfamily domain-containing protein [Cordyceps javanica]
MAPFYMSPLSEWQLGVTVAWICVLPKEYNSGRLLFDQIYSYDEKGFVADYDDDNGYELGRIGNYDVVMNCPIGNIGHYHAYEIVKKMLGTFPNIRAALLVGIGGGVPNLALGNDIRLGDVVVSSKIFAYETGRRTDTGVEIVPRLIEPEKNLSAAAFKFLSDLRQDETLLQDKMDQAASKPKNVADYRRPGIDHLFVSDYLHSQRCQCRLPQPRDQSIMVRRQDRHEGSLLRMHIGSVGSADQLLKSAHERDRLSNRDKIICVEMEAAVVMRGNCITVRGISDYCDGHKSDDWHDYAALSAAVCAKELLQRIPPNKFNQLRRYMTPQECYSLVRGVIQRLRDELAYNVPQDADEDLAALNRTLAVIRGRSDFLKLYAQDNRFQRESSAIGDTANAANQAKEAEEMAANIKNLQQELTRLVKEIQSNVKQKANAAPAVTRQEWEELNAKVEATAKEVKALKHSRQALEETSKILEEISKITGDRRFEDVSDKFSSIAEILTNAYGLAKKCIPLAEKVLVAISKQAAI